MTNRTICLSAFGLLYVATASCVVSFQGTAYRRSLSRRREAKSVGNHRPIPIETAWPIDPLPEPMRGTLTKSHAADRPQSPSSDRLIEPVTPNRPASPEVAAAPAIKLSELIVPNLEKLPADEEARLGKLLHMLILANHGADLDSPLQRTANVAARSILDQRGRQDVDVTITVLDSNEVNAFSHLGGYLYVTRGLFNLAATPEDFQFVIAHELAHLDRRDAQTLVAEATRAGASAGGLKGVGTLQALYHQIAAGYTEAQENQADDWAIDRLLKLDFSKRDCLGFLRRLVGYSEQNGFRGGFKPPKTDLAAPVQDLDNHYRSQPAAWKRLARLEARFNGSPNPFPAAAPSSSTNRGALAPNR